MADLVGYGKITRLQTALTEDWPPIGSQYLWRPFSITVVGTVANLVAEEFEGDEITFNSPGAGTITGGTDSRQLFRRIKVQTNDAGTQTSTFDSSNYIIVAFPNTK